MKPVSDFLPTPAQLLAVGDCWDHMTVPGRYALLNFGGKQGVMSPYSPWSEMNATERMELTHRLYLAKSFFNKVLP